MEMGPTPVEIMPSNSYVANDDQIESFGSTDFSTQSKDDFTSDKMEISKEPASTPPALVPSLKGTMTYSGGIVTCKGRWAMSDQAHEVEGQSSEFEFKLVKADSDSAFFPINGKYQGWFLIKQPPPLKGSVKIEDKDMIMKFLSRGDGTFTIQGQGHNRLGKFNLNGSLTNEGVVHIYREYFYLVPLPAAQKKGAVIPSVKKEDKKKEMSVVTKEQIPEPVSTPREGAARVRKQSSLLKEYHDPLQKVPPIRTVTPRETIKPSSSSSVSVNVSERSHRLSTGMKKCADLLKELSKLPQAQWFLEPVDPVKYNIPDYPKIIKYPMDFSTIRKNIETGAYDSINDYAEHMRLVFRNAITYNQAKDSLVNIAAREISNKFEDKFRVVVTQLDPASMMAETTPRGSSKLGGLKRSKSKDFTAARSGKFPPGPRHFAPQYNLPPAAVDGSTMKIIEMQQIIANMQDELKQLRTVVKESEISKRLNETKEAAQNPLSFDEKKALVAQIHKLPAEKMERVLAIIQEAMPQCGEGVVEVPIDSLDTLTLRKLQTFVQANLVEKKKRQYVPKSENSNKRPRKSRTPKSGVAGDNVTSNDDGLGLFDDGNDDLLFETDSFEDMVRDDDGDNQNNIEDPEEYARHVLAEYEKLRSNNNLLVDDDGNEVKFGHSSHHLDSPHDGLTSSGNDIEEEDDDNLWSEAAAEIQNKKQAYDDVYQV